jgi:outer membrane protein TolC
MQREVRETQQAEIIRQVKLAYYDLAYLDRALAVAEEDRELLKHFETLAQAQYSQGTGLQQAVLKLQADITRGQNRIEDLRRQRADAEAALNTLLDRPPETSVPRTELRLQPVDAPGLESLYEAGRRNRPELKAAFLDIEKNEKRIDVARKDYWPDIRLEANYIGVGKRSDPAGVLMPPPDNGKNIYNFTVGVKLPIRRRKYDAAVMEATEDFLASRESYRNAVNGVEAAIRSASFRLKTLREQISLFERVLVPQADQALRSGEAAYSTGSLGVLELLDSARVLLDVRLSLAQFETDYMKTLAEMERATGQAFPETQS